MTTSAARITRRLEQAIERLDDERLPLAEVARRVGAEADRLGLTRPSYERLRLAIHASRRLRARRGPSPLRVLLEDGAAGRLTRGTLDRTLKALDERRSPIL